MHVSLLKCSGLSTPQLAQSWGRRRKQQQIYYIFIFTTKSRVDNMDSRQRVFSTPELLRYILSFVEDRYALAASARVCTSWSDITLENLWRDHPVQPRALLSILSPMPEHRMAFSALPNSAGWARFFRYARHVRHIAFSDVLKLPHESPSHDLLKYMVLTRPPGPILPSLSSLIWDFADTNLSFYAIMFMHASIRSFTWRLPSGPLSAKALSSFLDNVVWRMPNLTAFELRGGSSVREDRDELLKLLSKLPKLVKVGLPFFFFTTEVAQVLSELPSLESICLCKHGYFPIQDVKQLHPTLHDTSFPCLKELEMAIHLPQLHGVDTAWPLHNLTKLHLQEIGNLTSDMALTMITYVCSQCPALESLSLELRVHELHVPNEDDEDDDLDPSQEIDIEAIRPLFELRSLKHLSISHDRQLCLSHEDIETIAHSFKALKTVILNPEPFFTDQAILSLGALTSFIRHCPDIEEIGLYIDGSQPPFDIWDMPAYPKSGRYLKTLQFGTSYIRDVYSVAKYLCPMIPSQCIIAPEYLYTVRIDPGWSVGDCRDRWNQVGEILSLLTATRDEEREKTRLLQSEVDSLRLQFALIRGAPAPGP
ncbi:hypothetical protein NEOLEDRAFT_306814 [Neolentinus lepideus HHB14362 ss-1]|uniref:F-box domain-containing protein n=1 Tax=Neolentinus lepideus HHB14362 ss-1 TaxID=1314782 RepID=A0A165VRD2_9AGAM|nr:hypothetical protein NEOLEDRAFT_306814 [Neolentinus lepideus HHB14362 ss-1]